MAYTESIMIDIGTQAPFFKLLDVVSNQVLTFQDCRGENGTVILFICNHCPYVIHVNRLIVDLANEYANKGIKFVAINSNDVANYPEDAPDKMAIVAKVLQYPFPYLYDESQEVARAYEAACTPDIYVFDSSDILYYRGRLDDSRPNSGRPLTGKDIKDALNHMLEGNPSPSTQYPSGGCNIKWKKC